MDILNQDMRPLGIINKFFAIEALGDNSVNKPHPEVFSTILKQLEMKGVKKNEILFVGDALVDLQAAKNAGVPFAAVTQGFLTSEDFVRQGLNRNMVFNSIADIKSLFK
jgi:phosphoglycolate phosphatase-like HAD superfamily hydrolase